MQRIPRQAIPSVAQRHEHDDGKPQPPQHSSQALREAAARAATDDVVRAVLIDLERLGYVDDRQFAGQWAASRVRLRGFGRRRIEQELRNKGVSRDIIRGALGRIFEDLPEADIAQREADKKLKSLARFDAETRRRRLAGFLERKGFSPEIIHDILRTAVR